MPPRRCRILRLLPPGARHMPIALPSSLSSKPEHSDTSHTPFSADGRPEGGGRGRRTPLPSLITERMAEAYDGLRRSWHEFLARDERGLADGGEELLPRLVFPAITQREGESLADIVELQLIDELHVRGEADDKVGR